MEVRTMFVSSVFRYCEVLKGFTKGVEFFKALDEAPKISIVGMVDDSTIDSDRWEHFIVVSEGAKKEIGHHILHGKALYFLLLSGMDALVAVSARHLYCGIGAVLKVVDPLAGVSTIVRVFY